MAVVRIGGHLLAAMCCGRVDSGMGWGPFALGNAQGPWGSAHGKCPGILGSAQDPWGMEALGILARCWDSWSPRDGGTLAPGWGSPAPGEYPGPMGSAHGMCSGSLGIGKCPGFLGAQDSWGPRIPGCPGFLGAQDSWGPRIPGMEERAPWRRSLSPHQVKSLGGEFWSVWRHLEQRRSIQDSWGSGSLGSGQDSWGLGSPQESWVG